MLIGFLPLNWLPTRNSLVSHSTRCGPDSTDSCNHLKLVRVQQFAVLGRPGRVQIVTSQRRTMDGGY